MRLDEAKVILEENGYELLEEGKLGRALATGALALGSLFGNTIAGQEQLNLRDVNDTNKIEEIKNDLENREGTEYCKIKSNGIICKHENSLTFFPSKTIKSVSDDVTYITFHKGSEGYDGMMLYYEDGSYIDIHYIYYPALHKIGKGYINNYDEFDTETQTQELSGESVKNLIQKEYNKIKNEFVNSKYVDYTDEEQTEENETNEDKINKIMAKYQK